MYMHHDLYNPLRKSKGVAYAIWLFLGLLGGHQFYLRKYGMGLLYLFTGGVFGIFWLIDAFRLSKMVDVYNYRYARTHAHYAGSSVTNNNNNNNNNNNSNNNNNNNNNSQTIIINNIISDDKKVETKVE